MDSQKQPVKFTDSELSQLNRIRDSYTEAQLAFGQLYLHRREVEANEAQLLTAYAKLQDDEKKFLDSVVEKYGEGNLDPKTGTFVPKS